MSGIILGVRRIWRDVRGQDLAEYGIALAVVVAAVAFLAIAIGAASLGLWTTGSNNIASAVSGS